MYQKMKTKLLALFLSIMMATVPSLAIAQEEGRITNLEEGDEAPYKGVLLDTNSAARLLAEEEYKQIECNLKINYETQKIIAQHALEMGNVQSALDSLKEQNRSILSIKDSEILRLQELALKNPNDNANWWFAGGLVAGIITSIAIFYAAVETSK